MNIKSKIHAAGVFQWEVAEAVGVTEGTMCRWLRRPERLKPGVLREIEVAIERIRAEKAVNAGGR